MSKTKKPDGRFAEWFRKRMGQLGIRTYRELSEASGLSERTITKLLANPKRSIDPSVALWLSRTLFVRSDVFRAFAEGKGPPPGEDRVLWAFYEAARPGDGMIPGSVRHKLARLGVAGMDAQKLLADAVDLLMAARGGK
jgi:hypothetical protein